MLIWDFRAPGAVPSPDLFRCDLGLFEDFGHQYPALNGNDNEKSETSPIPHLHVSPPGLEGRRLHLTFRQGAGQLLFGEEQTVERMAWPLARGRQFV